RSGDVKVFAEHRLFGDGVVDLHCRAFVTKANLQRVIRFAARQVLRPQQAVAMRLVAQIKELFETFAVANSAGHKVRSMGNIQHPTSYIEPPRSLRSRVQWMLDV